MLPQLHEATTVTGRCASWSYLSHLSWLFRRDIAYSTKQTTWLLIVDDCRDVDLVDRLAPAYAHSHVLLTTRSRATGVRETIPIEQMDTDTSVLFLLHRAGLLPAPASLTQVPAEAVQQATAVAKQRTLEVVKRAVDTLVE